MAREEMTKGEAPDRKMHRKNTGRHGEDMAAELLVDKGFRIVERNYRFGRGEIDIIARDKDTLVFVEVKCRNTLEYGPPEYCITESKIHQIRKVAACYLYERSIRDTDCRFDVVTILELEPGRPEINHIPNAF